MKRVPRPALEGSVAVRDGRRFGFAEFGDPRGEALVWMHGTPGARRQVPLEARVHAAEQGLRIIGIDRPGIGSSTSHLYREVADWTPDLELLLDALSVDRLRMIGLSGGVPYALAAAAAFPDRVEAVGVLGGVAPTVGPDAVSGGLLQLAARLAPALTVGRVPVGIALTQGIRLARPVAGRVLDAYAAVQPPGDKALLRRPELRAMFVDDLLHGSRWQTLAPLHDLVLLARDWGFALEEVRTPVRWWHGDADHIVPLAHARHVVTRLPDARLSIIPGESHLGAMGMAVDVLTGVTGLRPSPARRAIQHVG